MPTLEQVFQQEKAWIADCDDVDALIDKIGDFRDSARTAARDGEQLLRMRAGDLIELAQKRVVWLQAWEIREERARQAPTVAKVEPTAPMREVPRAPERVREVAAPARESPPQVTTAERTAREDAARAVAVKAQADARLAAAAAEKMELENQTLKAQLEAARRVVPAAASPAPPAPKPTSVRPVPAKPVAAASGTSMPSIATRVRPAARALTPTGASKPPTVPSADDGYSEADRLALASVGYPPTPPGHRGAFWTKHDDWPRDWTLTGGDLGRFRGEANLTRAVFAAQLGVPSAAVKDAEMSPRERVGPALQIALRRAMEHEASVRRRRREERAAASAVAVASDPVGPPAPRVAPAIEARPGGPAIAPVPFTGADLARLRAGRRLSQREMADLLGVEQGTISKGEGKAGAPLGPALQEAMARLRAERGAVMPE